MSIQHIIDSSHKSMSANWIEYFATALEEPEDLYDNQTIQPHDPIEQVDTTRPAHPNPIVRISDNFIQEQAGGQHHNIEQHQQFHHSQQQSQQQQQSYQQDMIYQ